MEVNAGTMATNITRLRYFLLFTRHIDGLQQKLTDEMAPKYVDVVEHNQIRTIDGSKARRLQALKVLHANVFASYL